MGTYQVVRNQNVTVSGTSAAVTNAFGSGIDKLRISSTTNCYWVLGDAPTATSAHTLLPAGMVDYITVPRDASNKIAFIQVTAGGVASAAEVA